MQVFACCSQLSRACGPRVAEANADVIDAEFAQAEYGAQGDQGPWPTCVIYATCGALHSVLQEDASITTPDVDTLASIIRSHNIKNASGEPIKNCGTTFPYLADQLNSLMRKGDLTFTGRYMGKLVDIKFLIEYKNCENIQEFIKDLLNDVSTPRHGIVTAVCDERPRAHGAHCMQTWDVEGPAVMVSNSWGDYKRHILVPGPDYGAFSSGCTIRLKQLMIQSGPQEQWELHPGWAHEGLVLECVAIDPNGGYVVLYSNGSFSVGCSSGEVKAGSNLWGCQQAMREKHDAGHRLKSVSFAPDGGCVILYDNDCYDILPGASGWKESSASWALWESLCEAETSGMRPKSVSFAPDGGHVIIYSNGGSTIRPGSKGWKEGTAFWGCREYFDASLAKNDSGEVKSVTFAPDGGYVLLHDSGFHMQACSDARQEAVPLRCWEVLSQIRASEKKVTNVCFAPDGGFVLLFEDMGFHVESGSQGWKTGTPILSIWKILMRLRECSLVI